MAEGVKGTLAKGGIDLTVDGIGGQGWVDGKISDKSRLAAEKKRQTELAAKLAPPKKIINKIGMKLTLIPAGDFMMGSNSGKDEEKPVHRVRISKAFYLGTTEVTQKVWKSVMGTEPWKEGSKAKEGNDYAASYISWNDAQAFCKKISEKEGKKYRLPTEAEWEYACRAGTTTKASFGDAIDKLGDYAWYKDNTEDVGEKYANRVGQKRPNPWGLYDIHGNVWEWCSDVRGSYENSPTTDPQGPRAGTSRVVRGGSCWNSASSCRSASRYYYSPSCRYGSLGFRVVCSSE